MSESKSKKIAISCTGRDMNDLVDPRFGRCSNFLVFEEGIENFTVIANRGATLGRGAGIQAAQIIVDNEIGVVLTGNIGPNANEILQKAGVETYLGCAGRIRDVLDDYNRGVLTKSKEPRPFGFQGGRWQDQVKP